MRAEMNDGTRRQTECAPTPQTLGTVIPYLTNDGALAGTKFMQRTQITTSDGALARWDGMAVRIFERFAQVSGDGLLQTRRNGVLQRLGLGIDFAPIQAKHARQQQFHQAMSANDAPRFA